MSDLHARLCLEHERFLCAYARKISRSDAEAQALISDVWYILMQKADELLPIMEDSVRTRSYIGNVVLHQAQRMRRDTAVRSKYDELYRLMNLRESAVPAAGEEAERRMFARQFRQAVQKLPDPYREVVLMRYYEGLSGEEIAKKLGILPASVNQYAKRAREKLKAILLEDGIVEGGCDYE